MDENKHVFQEYVYTYQGTEEVNGITYYVVYDMIRDNMKEDELYMIHLRQEGKRVLVLYDEYKEMMKARGHDMTDFDALCQYEVTQNGEMVLYDFNMEVGDKFRSVAGKEDITVVEKHKVWQKSSYTDQSELDVLVLSNGSMIVENVGYQDRDVSAQDLSATGSFFDYLNQAKGYRMKLELASWNGKYVYDDILDGSSPSGNNNGETEIILPETDNPQGDNTYDLFGRKVSHISSPGIYIRNGRKYVVK